MRVYVELPEELDVPVWSERHRRDEVPNLTPYGLHQIARNDVRVRFRDPLRSRLLGVAATKVRNRLQGTEVVAEVLGASRAARRTADVVLCIDERTGIPAVLVPGSPPVVSGIAWLQKPETLNRAHAAVARLALRRMAAVFTMSPGLAPIFAQAWDLPSERVHQVTLGIDHNFYRAQPWPEETALVIGVGDDRMRDYGTLIEAVRRVRAQGVPARLELGTTKSVDLPSEFGVLHARRLDGAVRDLYRRCGVVGVALHPNRYGSGLTVVLEAMASARPVVATANPGLESYVEHGVNGLLVSPGDADAFAKAVGELLTDPDRARAMGRAGRAVVEQHFTSQNLADDLYRVLRSATA